MSVHQLSAYSTLMTTHKVVISGSPSYLADRLKLKQPGDGVFPNRQLYTIDVPKVCLTLSRRTFIYRGVTLWNMLPLTMRQEKKTATFKNNLRKWVKSCIRPKPL